MKVITWSQTVAFSNSDTCEGVEFSFEDTDLNIAVITVHGRYPASGHLTNEVCKEIGYVASGSGKIGMEGGKVYDLKPGDAVFINPANVFTGKVTT